MLMRQIISLWIIATLWVITTFVWYMSDSYSWGFTQFIQSVVVWGVFAFLMFFSLAKKDTPASRNKELLKKIERCSDNKQYIDGMEFIDKLEATKELPQKEIDDIRNVFEGGGIIELYELCSRLVKQKEYTKASELAEQVISLVMKNETTVYKLPRGTLPQYFSEAIGAFEGKEEVLTLPLLRNILNEAKNRVLSKNHMDELETAITIINDLFFTKYLPRYLKDGEAKPD